MSVNRVRVRLGTAQLLRNARVGHGWLAAAGVVVTSVLLTSLPACSGGSSQERPGHIEATIRTTSYGIPHIIADDYAGIGLGLGYSTAKDKVCDIAEIWLTVNAERARFFGAGPGDSNVRSDFFWKRIHDFVQQERLLHLEPPLGPTLELQELVRGFVAGYNEYLADTGIDNLPDPTCRGSEWVRPITERDVYLRAMFRNIRGIGNRINQYVNAAPPSLESEDIGSSEGTSGQAETSANISESNVIMLGRDATDNGRGMALINPHFPWGHPSGSNSATTEGKYEVHLTIPGRLNVAGIVHLGTPTVWSGWTDNVVWQHTSSRPEQATFYRLKLDSTSDTTYEFDGKRRQMRSRTVSVDVLRPDGRLEERRHTFWETHFGPMIATAQLPWTSTTGYAIREDLMLTFRWIDQDLAINHAQSVEDIDDAGRTFMDMGWLNIHATDSTGKVFYADRSGVPHVTDALAAACGDDGEPFVLDGSRSVCEWGTDPDSVTDGAFGPSSLPMLVRHDYVHDANNGHWATNLRKPLEGFPRIVQPNQNERGELSLRGRAGHLKIERRLAGTDGEPGNRFTLDQLQRITWDNHVLLAELWREDVVDLCRSMPPEADVADACEVLANWDETENLDSPGAVLWRRFDQNLGSPLWTIPFDPDDPLNTPRGLDTDNPAVAEALTQAAADLRDSGIPLDAVLRDYQYIERGGERFPVTGGNRGGQYHPMSVAWIPGEGFPNPTSGSYYRAVVQFTDDGPVARSIQWYGQSNNPESPHSTDQLRLFSEKELKDMHWSEEDIASDPNLVVNVVRANPRRASR